MWVIDQPCNERHAEVEKEVPDLDTWVKKEAEESRKTGESITIFMTCSQTFKFGQRKNPRLTFKTMVI